MPWVPTGRHGTQLQSFIRDIFGLPGQYKMGLGATAPLSPPETWRTLRDKWILGLAPSQANLGRYPGIVAQGYRDLAKAQRMVSGINVLEEGARTPLGNIDQRLEAISRAQGGNQSLMPRQTGDPELDSRIPNLLAFPGQGVGTQSLVDQAMAYAEAARLSEALKKGDPSSRRDIHALAPYIMDTMAQPFSPVPQLNIGKSGLPLNEMQNMSPKEDND